MKRTIFAVIFLAAALMLNGCSAKPAVTAPETQTPVTETTTAGTEDSTTAAETQELPKENKEQQEKKNSRQLVCRR